MEIEKQLQEYKKMKAERDKKYLDKEALNKLLYFNKTVYKENENEAIEAMQLSANVIKEDVSFSTKIISSKTESTAINYIKEMFHINKIDKIEILNKIKSIENEIFVLNQKIERIDFAINRLKDKEKFVIIQKYFKGYNNQEVAAQFEKNFGYGSVTTVENKLKDAKRKITDFFTDIY